jgi:hypothetical protein
VLHCTNSFAGDLQRIAQLILGANELLLHDQIRQHADAEAFVINLFVMAGSTTLEDLHAIGIAYINKPVIF